MFPSYFGCFNHFLFSETLASYYLPKSVFVFFFERQSPFLLGPFSFSAFLVELAGQFPIRASHSSLLLLGFLSDEPLTQAGPFLLTYPFAIIVFEYIGFAVRLLSLSSTRHGHPSPPLVFPRSLQTVTAFSCCNRSTALHIIPLPLLKTSHPFRHLSRDRLRHVLFPSFCVKAPSLGGAPVLLNLLPFG